MCNRQTCDCANHEQDREISTLPRQHYTAPHLMEFHLPFDYPKGSFTSLTLAYIPAASCQLLVRERRHLAGHPEDAIVLRHQLGIGRKACDARRPRQVVNRGGHYRGAILIARNQGSGCVNPGYRSLLVTPLREHMERSDQKARLVLRHHVADVDCRSATTWNVAERFEVFDRVNLQTQWNCSVAAKGHDLFLR